MQKRRAGKARNSRQETRAEPIKWKRLISDCFFSAGLPKSKTKSRTPKLSPLKLLLFLCCLGVLRRGFQKQIKTKEKPKCWGEKFGFPKVFFVFGGPAFKNQKKPRKNQKNQSKTKKNLVGNQKNKKNKVLETISDAPAPK